MTSDISERVRKQVAERAGGVCEYCRLSEEDSGYGHQVDHIVSRKHGGKSTEDNLAYACIVCNRFKGSDIATVDSQTGEVTRLFNPRRDRWSEHFQLEGPLIRPVGRVGLATSSLLRLNAPERVQERHLLQVLGSYPLS